MRIPYLVIITISIILTAIWTVRVRKNKAPGCIWLSRMLGAAFVAEIANLSMALPLHHSEARITMSFSLYFASIDWILFFLLCFVAEYAYGIGPKGKNHLAITSVVSAVDTVSLMINFITGTAFSIYTEKYVDGDTYYHISGKLPYEIHLFYSYFLIIVIFVFLILKLITARNFYRLKYATTIGIVSGIVILNGIYIVLELPLDWSVILYFVAGSMVYYFSVSYVPKTLITKSLRRTTDELSEGLIIFDVDDKCLYANNFARDFFRLETEGFTASSTPVSEWLDGKKFRDTEPFETENKISGESDDVWYRLTLKNIRDRRDSYLGSYFIIEDVTVRHKAMAALAQAKEEAEAAREVATRASNAKGQFLANMSHEIRTPINAILGMNEMILREDLSPEVREFAGNIAVSGEALLSLVNDILDFSKIESGKMELVPDAYEPFSVIRSCDILIQPKLKDKDIKLTVECDENCPKKLYGDEARIRQILTNLMTNAAKYTEKGSINVSLKWVPKNDCLGNLVLSVKDTGIGIAEENREKLFDAFTRVDEKRNRNIEGTGLGLSITSRLISMMGGNIELESEYGVGSTFTATIPQAIEDATASGPYTSEKHETSAHYTELFRAPSAKILAVDDYRMNLVVLKGLLKKTEVSLILAYSGPEAIEKAGKEKFDLILMDHMMPEMDGIEARKIIASGDGPNKDTPMIMLTANAISGVEEKYLKEGFAGYLSKPINSKQLEKTLMQYIPKEKIVS